MNSPGHADDTHRRTRRAHIRAVTANLAEFHTPLSPAAAIQGFRGWHSRGYLPHFDQPDTVQAVTFRLADSLPAHVAVRLAAMADSPAKRKLREDWLDRSRGACWLRQPEIARLVEDALLHFDGERYRLCAWCVMPNHVHTLFELRTTPLGEILKSWKGYTAREANRLLGRQGAFWEKEYWDRFMRDERHFRDTVRYIENNPVKARLTKTSDPREWLWSSARKRDEYERLPSERGGRPLEPTARACGARGRVRKPALPGEANCSRRRRSRAGRNDRAPGPAARRTPFVRGADFPVRPRAPKGARSGKRDLSVTDDGR